jgi:hypothetical protein
MPLHDDGWLLISLTLPPADHRGGRNDGVRALLLHVLREWLAEHHQVPALLPGAGTRRQHDVITVGFRAEQAETALAFRRLCHGLGLGEELRQWRVQPNHCPRTTPLGRTTPVGGPPA